MAHTLVPFKLCQWLLLVPPHSAQKCRVYPSYLGQENNVSLLKRYLHDTAIGALKVQRSKLPETTEEEEEKELKKAALKQSRNEKKREASRAVKWGMQLVKFSPAQIKRIIRVTSLEDEVLNAVMLVKKLGPDVREGKRRQFNYIGGLLRKVQPDLMEAVLQATKDGEMDKLHALSGNYKQPIEDVEVEANESDEEEEMDEEVLLECVEIAKRWSEGLISGDASVTKEVYSIYNIDFDRKELRKLVREVRTKQECKIAEEDSTGTEVDKALSQARKSLHNILFGLAKQSSVNAF